MTKKEKIIIIAVVILIALLYFYPAFMNDFPKGSDSWYHMRIAEKIKNGENFLYDELNAGGAKNNYPPLFPFLMAFLYMFSNPVIITKFIGPAFGLLSAIAFYFLARDIAGKKTAIISTLVFGTVIESGDMFVFSAYPENAGLFLLLLSLFLLNKNKKNYCIYAMATASALALTHALSFAVFVLFAALLHGKTKKILPVIIVPAMLLLAWYAFAGIGSLASGKGMSIAFLFERIQAFYIAPAIIGLIILLKKRVSATGKFVLLFLLLLALSFALPFYGERMPAFLSVPLSLAAGTGALMLFNKKSTRIITALILAAGVAMTANWSFMSQSEMTKNDYQALMWMKENLGNETVAATWQVSGVWINAVAEKKNILGAYHEAVKGYAERRKDLGIIFNSGSKEEVLNAMKKYDAGYIFINGLEEEALYRGSIKRLENMFEEVYSNGYSHVFKA